MIRLRPSLLILTLIFSSLCVSVKAAENTIQFSFDSKSSLYSEGTGPNVVGALPDMMTELFEQHLGLKVVSYGYPWARAQALVKNGSHDALVTNGTSIRAKYAHISKQTVITLNVRAVVKKGSDVYNMLSKNPSFSALEKLKICYARGNGWAVPFALKHGIKLYEVKDNNACFRMIDNGRMDLSLQVPRSAEKVISSMRLEDRLNVLPSTYDQWNFKLLIRKDFPNSAALVEQFDKTLEKLKANGRYPDLLNRVIEKHLQNHEQ